MTEASIPTTRLRATDALLGITNSTRLFAPMLKLSQFMARRLELCCTISDWPWVLTVPAPPTTCPPVGSCAGGGPPWAAAPVASTAATAAVATTAPPARPLPGRLPRPRAHSATATRLCVKWFQTSR